MVIVTLRCTRILSNAGTVSSAGSSLGTGGMSTKLTAARLATSAGVTTIITRSSTPSNIFHIVAHIQSLPATRSVSPALSRKNSHSALNTLAQITIEDDPPTHENTAPPTPAERAYPLHTRFTAKPRAIRGRYFWILHGLKPHGTLIIDEGAYRALTRTDKAGLLPVGVLDVQGTFAQQECVNLVVAKRVQGGKGYEVVGTEVGRALVNYTSTEISRVMGKRSSKIQELLGYAGKSFQSLEIAWTNNGRFRVHCVP